MELRQLRYFVAVAEAGNISRAAKTIFLTQPALSRQIKALEDEIGQCLFDRGAHSIRLTPAGESLLPAARELLQHAELVLQRIRSSKPEVRLRVGYAPSVGSGLLAAAVACFTQTHPGVRVDLLDLSTREMRAGLESNALDVVLSVGHAGEAHGLKWIGLVDTAWMLAVNRENSLAGHPEVTPAEVARECLLVFSQREYPEYWTVITAWLRQHGLRPTLAGEYDGVESLMSAVEAGLGVAVVTTGTTHLFPGRAQFKPLTAGPQALCIVAGYRLSQAHDKPLAVFVEELRKAAQTWKEL